MSVIRNKIGNESIPTETWITEKKSYEISLPPMNNKNFFRMNINGKNIVFRIADINPGSSNSVIFAPCRLEITKAITNTPRSMCVFCCFVRLKLHPIK